MLGEAGPALSVGWDEFGVRGIIVERRIVCPPGSCIASVVPGDISIG